MPSERAVSRRAPPFIDPPGYARHRPEATLLYQLVERHYAEFVAAREAAGRPLPRYVQEEFAAYLKCGRLEHGFLRVRCDDCHAETLVAFSCKRRGFCPSCAARRTTDSATLLADEVLPAKPIRQWVLSLPLALRFLLATDPAALTQVLGIVHRTISAHILGIARSINYALAHFGYEPVEPDRLAVHIGPPIDQAFSAITGVESEAELRGFVSKYRERYAEVGYSENTLYPGIAEALSALSAAGVTLGVCTSKRIDFAEKILTMFALRSHFRFVSGGDVGIHKWQQLESLLTQRQISHSSVMVGDRAVDLSAAHRNSLQSAGVLWGHGSRAELENEWPSCLLASPAELTRFAGS